MGYAAHQFTDVPADIAREKKCGLCAGRSEGGLQCSPGVRGCWKGGGMGVHDKRNDFVRGVDIQARSVVLGGQSFGAAGAYEKIAGTIRFAADPAHPLNRRVTDIGLAQKNADGRVEFSGDFYLLKPVDMSKGNGRLLLDVANRGRKVALGMFNSTPRVPDPGTPEDFGNGFLMRHGYTVAWVGWQTDVPRRDGLMALDVPRARGVTGFIRCELRPNTRVNMLPLADRYHIPNPVADLARSARRECTVREHAGADAVPSTLPRSAWRFSDPGHIEMKGGFTPGAIYDVVYRSADPPLVGLGFLAVRDTAALAALGARRERQSLRRRARARLSLRRLADRALPAPPAVSRSRRGRAGAHGLRRGDPARRRRPARRIQPAPRPAFAERAGSGGQPASRSTTDGLLTQRDCARSAGRVPQHLCHQHLGRVLARRRFADPHRCRGARATSSRRISCARISSRARSTRRARCRRSRPTPIPAAAARSASTSWTTRRCCAPRWSTWTAGSARASSRRRAPSRALPTAQPWRPNRLRRILPHAPRRALPRPHRAARCASTSGPTSSAASPRYPPEAGAPYRTYVSAIDADGNEVAGIRPPELAAPLATYHRLEPAPSRPGRAGRSHVHDGLDATVPAARAQSASAPAIRARPSRSVTRRGRHIWRGCARPRSNSSRPATCWPKTSRRSSSARGSYGAGSTSTGNGRGVYARV